MDMLITLGQAFGFIGAAAGTVIAGTKLLPMAEDFFASLFSEADAE